MRRARAVVVVLLAAMPLSASAEERRLEWKQEWGRFRPAEYAFTAGAFALTPLFTWALPEPPPGWSEPLLFDTAARDALAFESRDGQRRAQLASDVIQNALILYPFLVDAGLTAWLLDDNLDVASQLALIDLESFALQALIVVATKRVIGRVRPGLDPCPEGGYACRSRSQRRSFASGHAAAAYTGAALLCLHHRQLPLYGSRAADGLACAGGVALAVTDALLRIAADDHHATDVLASGTIGVVAGYVVPYLLHYAPEGDGKLDGMLHVGAIAGAANTGDDALFATGIDAGARAHWWWNDEKSLGVELGGSGLLAGTREGLYYREGRAALRLWGEGFAIGPEVAYRAGVGPRARADREEMDEVVAGASLAFGLLEEEQQVLVTASWLPLGDGYSDLIEAGLEVAAFRYGMVALRVRRMVRRDESSGALFFLSLGGRLPW